MKFAAAQGQTNRASSAYKPLKTSLLLLRADDACLRASAKTKKNGQALSFPIYSTRDEIASNRIILCRICILFFFFRHKK